MIVKQEDVKKAIWNIQAGVSQPEDGNLLAAVFDALFDALPENCQECVLLNASVKLAKAASQPSDLEGLARRESL